MPKQKTNSVLYNKEFAHTTPSGMYIVFANALTRIGWSDLRYARDNILNSKKYTTPHLYALTARFFHKLFYKEIQSFPMNRKEKELYELPE